MPPPLPASRWFALSFSLETGSDTRPYPHPPLVETDSGTVELYLADTGALSDPNAFETRCEAKKAGKGQEA